MPRIPPWLFRRARKHSDNTATLLPACKDLGSAINELRWIREHVESTTQTRKSQAEIDRIVARLCTRRGQGVPLQYILGSQPFGPLTIKCRPGVLIPRPETEAYTSHLIDLIKSKQLPGPKTESPQNGLSIIDFCTGTGCIPILFFASLQKHVKNLSVVGVDISPNAVQLAQDNIAHNITTPLPGQSVHIVKGDIFEDYYIETLPRRRWDIMISNPPYISQRVWSYGLGSLGLSVRKYEPPLALVPDAHLPVSPGWHHEDVFYARLLDVATKLKPRFMLFEIGDEKQAHRVVRGLFAHQLLDILHIEVWRDWPDVMPVDEEEGLVTMVCKDGELRDVPVKGSGQMRSILVQPTWRNAADKTTASYHYIVS